MKYKEIMKMVGDAAKCRQFLVRSIKPFFENLSYGFAAGTSSQSKYVKDFYIDA